MPICDVCMSEADSRPGAPKDSGVPPYGMKWGQTCDRCGRVAEVTVGN